MGFEITTTITCNHCGAEIVGHGFAPDETNVSRYMSDTCEYCDGKTHQLAPFPGTREYYDFLEDRWVEEADSLDGAEVAIGKDKDGFAIKATAWFDNGYVSGFTRVPINHCPMCGRDLRGDE